MNKKETLQLADDGYTIVQQYIWVTVNVSGVQVFLKVFIMRDEHVYDLLLLKRQKYIIFVVEDRAAGNLNISSKHVLKKVVYGQEADSFAVQLVDALEVKDLEMDLADEQVYYD